MHREDLNFIDGVRSNIPEIDITADLNLNSDIFQRNVKDLPIVILRNFLKHPDCSELSSSDHVGRASSNTTDMRSSEGSLEGKALCDFSLETLEKMYGAQKITIQIGRAHV